MTRLIVAVSWVAFALQGALAHAAGADPWGLLGALPERVDAAVMIDDAGAQLRAPAGRALSAFFDEAGLFEETARAWRELADALGLDDEGAVDALLGTRVTLAIDFAEGPSASVLPPARWALITRVRAGTAGRLRQTLKASPRELTSGVPVYAVEGGRFELAVVRPRGAPDAQLVVAPGESGGLLDAVIAAATRPDHPADAALAGAARELGAGPILGFVRTASLPGETDTLLAWRGEQTASGWAARLYAPECESLSGVPAITRDAFDLIARDALLAVLVPDGPERVTRALRVQPMGVSDDPGFFRGALLAMALGSGSGDAGSPFTLGFVLGLDASAPRARFDALIGAYLVPFLPARPLADVDRGALIAGPSFQGRFPDATRVQAIKLEPIGLAKLVGPSAEVAWRYASPDGHDFAAVAVAPGGVPVPAGELVAGAAEALERHACAVVGSPGLVSAGVVRPAELAGAFGPGGPLPGSLRWVRAVRWAAEPGPGGAMRGDLTVEMALEHLGAGSP